MSFVMISAEDNSDSFLVEQVMAMIRKVLVPGSVGARLARQLQLLHRDGTCGWSTISLVLSALSAL